MNIATEKESKRFRLGVSTSAFLYAMPWELAQLSVVAAQRGRASMFDARQNGMMQSFMRELMAAINSSSIASMECYHSLSWKKEPVIEILLDNPQVELWSVHAPYGRWFNPSSPEQESRNGALAACMDAVYVATCIGARVLVVHPGADIPYDEPRDVRLKYAVEVLRQVADAAGERSIKVAVEPMPLSEIGNTIEEIFAVIEGINRPNVGINFDTNHLFPPEEIPDLIRQCGSLILSVHISDQDGQERHWMPFEGKIDWQQVLLALAEIGYEGPLIYEAHIREAENCLEVVRRVEENYAKLIKLAPR
jgi:sugar phosphate isomerase/epimerase